MKKLLLSFVLLLFAIPQFLQGQDGWIKEFPGPTFEVPGNIIATSDGNYVFAAYAFDGFGNGSSPGTYIIKVDINGNTLWVHNALPEVSFPAPAVVIQTNDNGFLIKTLKNDGNGSNKFYFIKLDENLNEEWSDFFLWDNNISTNNIRDFIQTANGDFILGGSGASGSIALGYLQRLDSNFNEIWTITNPYSSKWRKIKELPGGEILTVSINGSGGSTVIKTSSDGNPIWQKYVPNPSNQFFKDIHVLQDGSIVLFTDNSSNNPHHQIKLDSSGDLISDNEIQPAFSGSVFYETIQVSDGFISVGTGENNIPFNVDSYSTYLIKTDFDGNVVWDNEVNQEIIFAQETARHLVSTSDNGIMAVGTVNNNQINVFKTDSLGNIYSNKIIGNVARDEQPNCLFDSSETKLKGWVVSAENTSQTFYTGTDSMGRYTLPVAMGDYILSIHPPNVIWEACENQIDISVPSFATIDQNFSLEAIVDCPLLVVSASLPAARPCFDNNRYYVNYCNEGTITANDAYVQIQVENQLSYVSSSIPLTSQNGTIYTFDLGDISSGGCGNFYVDFLLDCDAELGASTCISSHIYPDSSCINNQNWNGAFVEVDVECQDSLVTFYLENTGNADMPTSNNYMVVEDAILLIYSDFQLLSGQVDSISIPTNTSTFTMIAEQVENAPGDPFPTSWAEGCGVDGLINFSTGYINQFSLGDNIPYLDRDCRVISSSFDPNDKQGFPLGYSDEHFIHPNTDLEYLVRFQNTGTDTAFTVVVRDTITAELDIPTIQVGASSHSYEWRIYGENILEFTFNAIMLPDSNANEPASHGFVEFKISQKEDLPLGTVIKNDAAIYFDYNDPIITNETFHTLGENFITVSLQRPIKEDYSLLVRPNPLQEFAIFEMKKEIKNGLFELYDVSGKLTWQQKFNGSEFELKRNDLTAGIYFYKISENGNAINSGKIIIN